MKPINRRDFLHLSFQGGVAANAGMVRAFRELYGLEGDELVIPDYHASMGAIGSVLYALENETDRIVAKLNLDKFTEYLNTDNESEQFLKPLIFNGQSVDKRTLSINGTEKKDAWLGIDVGP